jgi:mRNA-degrading endonuclease toxin of MazEF toxin-antitoxin module
MSTQEILIEEIKHQPEPVLRELWHYLPFLDKESVANVQAIGSLPSVRFEKRLGVLPAADLEVVKKALVRACAL